MFDSNDRHFLALFNVRHYGFSDKRSVELTAPDPTAAENGHKPAPNRHVADALANSSNVIGCHLIRHRFGHMLFDRHEFKLACGAFGTKFSGSLAMIESRRERQVQ